MSACSMMIQNEHEIYSMCRHLQCTSCIAAIAFVLGSVEFYAVNAKCVCINLQLLSAGGTGSSKTGESLQIHACYAIPRR